MAGWYVTASKGRTHGRADQLTRRKSLANSEPCPLAALSECERMSHRGIDAIDP